MDQLKKCQHFSIRHSDIFKVTGADKWFMASSQSRIGMYEKEERVPLPDYFKCFHSCIRQPRLRITVSTGNKPALKSQIQIQCLLLIIHKFVIQASNPASTLLLQYQPIQISRSRHAT